MTADTVFQTKDLECAMDYYEIREDGSLWHELYDIEDHSELGKWRREHPGEEKEPEELSIGLRGFIGSITRVNKRMEQLPTFHGEIRFYTSISEDHTGWVEFSTYFVAGKLVQIHLLSYKPAATP